VIALALLLGCAPTTQRSPDRPCDATGVEQSPDPFDMVWAGDTLLGDAATADLRSHGYSWPFDHLKPLLEDAAVRVVNLEGPVTVLTEPFSPQKYSYNADPVSARALARAGFTLAGLANNHAMDRGTIGLADTQHHLGLVGIQTFGAGMSRSEALQPAIVETAYGTLGLVGFTERYANAVMATERRGGVVALTEGRAHDVASMARAIGVDHLVAFVHWGDNYSDVLPSQRRMAGWLVEAGYDLVVGHGAHLQQEVEVRCGVPIAYSIGNLAFGTPGRFTEQVPGYGIVLRTELGEAGFQALEAQCIRTDNSEVHFQPRPCEASDAEEVLRDFLIGADVVGNLARLEL